MRPFRYLATMSCAMGFGLVSACQAGDITYSVERTVGGGGVTGTITTDGTTGVLGASNIVSFDLTLNGIGLSSTLKSPSDGVFTAGTGLTATRSDIFFDFGNSGAYLLFQTSFGSGSNYYADAAVGVSPGFLLQGESVNPGQFNDSHFINVPQSANQIIATAAVPEPTSLVTLGTGAILALAYSWRRRVTTGW